MVAVNATKPLALDRSLSANGITFRYPHAWPAQRLQETSSFTNLLATMSTVHVPQPCHAVPHGVDCGALLSHIGRSDVLVSWVQMGMPGRRLTPQLGAALTVDGHPARLSTSAQRNCPPGTAAEVDGVVAIERSSSHDELLEMLACAGPDAQAQAIATARAMFTAVRIHWPA